jgi:TetR/AcrR family tetracycline transcriptional repressor
MANDAGAKPPGLTRTRVVAAALDLVQENGLDALSMRTLADRLEVKAASLYWHVRDRNELLTLLATALLAEVHLPIPRGDWRGAALAICAALEQLVAHRRDAGRLLLDAPDILEQSAAHTTLADILAGAGLTRPEAAETATLMLGAVLVGSRRPPEGERAETAQPVLLAIDTGSHGVTVRAGSGFNSLVRAAYDPDASAPAVIHGDRVIVRRLRGGRRGELELNATRPWRFRVQAPTWNTVLDLTGIDVRDLKIDSGAAHVECILPPPRGVVPIDISSGVVGVRLRRPPGVPVVADVSTGAVQLRLDGQAIPVTTSDHHWESVGGATARNCYWLTISSGTVRVTVEEDATLTAKPGPVAAPVARAGITAALNVVLDGVAARGGNLTGKGH